LESTAAFDSPLLLNSHHRLETLEIFQNKMSEKSTALSNQDKFSETDIKYMQLAFDEARKALNCGEVPIGCVLIQPETGRVIASGGNETNATSDATRHAEIVAIEFLMNNNLLENGCDLYVTVEPCIMCAEALIGIKIRRVVYGSANEKFGGCGSVLSVHDSRTFPNDPLQRGFTCCSGLGNDEAIELLRQFYLRGNEKAPRPRPDGMAQRVAKRINQEKHHTDAPPPDTQLEKNELAK
jgi:tRNA-specific adenosine deaminase 2